MGKPEKTFGENLRETWKKLVIICGKKNLSYVRCHVTREKLEITPFFLRLSLVRFPVSPALEAEN